MDLNLEFDNYLKLFLFIISTILLTIAPTFSFSVIKREKKKVLLPLTIFLFNLFCILEFFLYNKFSMNLFKLIVILIPFLIVFIGKTVKITDYRKSIFSTAIVVTLTPSIYIIFNDIGAKEVILIPILLFYLYSIIISIIKLRSNITKSEKKFYFFIVLALTVSMPIKVLFFFIYNDGSTSLLLLIIINLFLYLFYINKIKVKSGDTIIQLAEYNLTKRETEVVQLILKGLNNLEISEKLFISENTIKRHIYNIYRKMNISTRYELFSKLQL